MRLKKNNKHPYLSVSAFACPNKNRFEYLSKCDWNKVDSLHIDIMDGDCVPLVGLSWLEIELIDKNIFVPLDIHLMVKNQEEYLDRLINLINLKTIILTIEGFSKEQTRRLLEKVKSLGKCAGIAIWPKTDINEIGYYSDLINVLLIMSTEAGVPNSQFIESTYERIKKVADYLPQDISIWVDGALNHERACILIRMGVEGFIFGRAFFNPSQKLKILSL
nr:hypothetical protein [uncultured Sphaerochaeta sp.]